MITTKEDSLHIICTKLFPVRKGVDHTLHALEFHERIRKKTTHIDICMSQLIQHCDCSWFLANLDKLYTDMIGMVIIVR